MNKTYSHCFRKFGIQYWEIDVKISILDVEKVEAIFDNWGLKQDFKYHPGPFYILQLGKQIECACRVKRVQILKCKQQSRARET